MNENHFPESTMLGTQSDSLLDVDYMGELLLEGCWLETSNGSEFLHQSPSSSSALFNASFPRPNSESNNDDTSPLNASQEDRQRLSFSDNLSVSQSQEKTPKWDYQDGNVSKTVCSSSQSRNVEAESSELSRRWWIGPSASTSVMDRLIKALGYIKDWSGDNKNVLIQIWVPVNKAGRRVLTTNDQPFSIDLNNPSLVRYRDISVKYQFPTERDSKDSVGLPGRVFMGKVPEWTPDVQFFARNEYPRVGHAQQYDVRGTLGVPIFEEGSRNCLGVIEVVLTTQKINYSPEFESVCKALKAVDLRSTDASSTQNIQVHDFSYESALPEILDIFREACRTHNLPLGQAWVPCIIQGKWGRRHSDENLVCCVSTVDSACYIADPRAQGFNEACSEHHLLKGQGIVGRAFTTNQPCFSPDITTFTKTDYPLSHHARMFGLCAAVAIRLRSIHSCSTDFVLEFFLPVDCKDSKEHMKMLSSLSLIIQKVCRRLRVITDEELLEETPLPMGVRSVASFIKSTEEIPIMEHKQSTMTSDKMSSWTSTSMEVEERVGVASEVHSGKTTKVLSGKFLESMQYQSDMSSGNEIVFGDSVATSADCSLLNASKNGEKRRAKAEKTITLELLRQYFAGSLKDAAKSIGVCPTTLKRICRQHGIKRWPSRKIKKVGYSLQKIQRVIDSVEGASGSLQIGSFYTNFPELAAPNSLKADLFPSLKSSDHAEPLSVQPRGSILSPHVSASKSPSSSCSQSSSSSLSHSSGTQPHFHTVNLSGQEDSAIKDNLDGLPLKRVRSDVQLHLSSDGPNPLKRSQSHVSFMEHNKSEELPLVLPETVPCCQEGSANTLRVKATYGEEKIRFRILKSWGYSDLMREIGKRFGIDDTSGFHLKYLDDDSEWILLTCDADLEECVEVCQAAGSQTIKLSLARDSQQLHGSSSGRTYL